jgi:hypothetical protein
MGNWKVCYFLYGGYSIEYGHYATVAEATNGLKAMLYNLRYAEDEDVRRSRQGCIKFDDGLNWTIITVGSINNNVITLWELTDGEFKPIP